MGEQRRLCNVCQVLSLNWLWPRLASARRWRGSGARSSSSGRTRPPRERWRSPRAEPAERGGVFRRLRENLARSREALTAEVSSSFFDRLDAEAFERLEEALILADVGAPVTAQVVGKLEAEVSSGAVGQGEAARARLVELLAEVAAPDGGARIDLSAKPSVRDGGRGQRHRQDDDDRQARPAPRRHPRAGGRSSRRPTPIARPRSSSSRSGPSAPASRSCGASPAATPARWSSTRSARPRPATPTS